MAQRPDPREPVGRDPRDPSGGVAAEDAGGGPTGPVPPTGGGGGEGPGMTLPVNPPLQIAELITGLYKSGLKSIHFSAQTGM